MSNSRNERVQQGVEDGWVCVGALGASHGVRGELRLRSFTDDEETVFQFSDLRKRPNGAAIKIKKVRKHKDDFIVRVDGIENREDAQTLKSTKLYVPREVLDDVIDEDEFYLADLIGLNAIDEAGNWLGFVRAVENFGSEDLIEVVLDEPVKGLGRFAFIPFRKVFIPTIDLKADRLVVNWADWLKTQVIATAEEQEKSGKK
ncbi:ribosome maturation factor RimM [Kordiimonas sp. SCSIO 12610]|uniref:ribosome maturation factor RimM n=1 Tax=Kordiimonas sp. SCSIO 12610 TaxID=2829597 RepID=UPI00210A6566|nr:ribosome maturation factor RimM [Kordiimonas sp. SCSIO 12610]UTW55053.1 16S rRNA processing protein RimM [Kordiimonas sp. SCSIO 12610]